MTRPIADIPNLVERYLAGESAKQIAKSLGIYIPIVTRQLLKNGVELRSRSDSTKAGIHNATKINDQLCCCGCGKGLSGRKTKWASSACKYRSLIKLNYERRNESNKRYRDRNREKINERNRMRPKSPAQIERGKESTKRSKIKNAEKISKANKLYRMTKLDRFRERENQKRCRAKKRATRLVMAVLKNQNTTEPE